MGAQTEPKVASVTAVPQGTASAPWVNTRQGLGVQEYHPGAGSRAAGGRDPFPGERDLLRVFSPKHSPCPT